MPVENSAPQLALAAGCLVLTLGVLASAGSGAHQHAHGHFKQQPGGHPHDSGPHRQDHQPERAGPASQAPVQPQAHPMQMQQQQQQQMQQMQATNGAASWPASAPGAPAASGGSGAGQIIAPLATGALLGAALGGAGASALAPGAAPSAPAAPEADSKRNQRHTDAGQEAGERAIVDLSHPLHNGTLHWPEFADFQYTILSEGEHKSARGVSIYHKSDSISTALHLGTHLDAPAHFSRAGWPVDQIPLQRLVDVPVSVIDVSDKVKVNRSYTFERVDFFDAGTNASLVRPRSVVLVYTGLSELYDQGERAYLGTDTRNVSEMKVPGFSGEAAEYLIERAVYGVGLDAPSADSSERHAPDGSVDALAHALFSSNNIYILENVSAKLRQLVGASAARLTIAPLPIVNGSGSPVRLIAVLGKDEPCACQAHNSAAPSFAGNLATLSLVAALALPFATGRLAVLRPQ